MHRAYVNYRLHSYHNYDATPTFTDVADFAISSSGYPSIISFVGGTLKIKGNIVSAYEVF